MSQNLEIKIGNFFHFVHSGRFYGQISSCGYPLDLRYPTYLTGGKYIKIGKNFHASYRLRIEAWDQYKNVFFEPSIIIGDNVSFSDNCHVGAINLIKIGNNVLFGSNVYITDHFHGTSSSSDLGIHPLERDLCSKGSVIIEDDVWVGDGVCIMPNVSIGSSCIVGANSVVTKSFPSNCVIAGCPAKIIKYLK
jgi:acetyltransferase-like isoleucine patch superfamily enzyme